MSKINNSPLKSPKPSSHKSFTRPSTPSRSSFLYSPHHSRSKSSLPHPKVLPFPDIPVRPISHESSRAGSPLPSPALTRRSSSQDANRLIRESQHSSSPTSTPFAVGMVITASSDSGEHRDARSHHPHVASSSSLNPTSPTASSPLSTSTPSYSSTVVEAGPSRLRSQTTPSSSATRPIPVPPVLDLNHPNRSQGFEQVIVSPPNNMSSPSPVTSPMAIPRASSLPTNTPTTGLPRETARPPHPVKKLSNPPPSPPAATQIAPIPSHKVLSDHMYQSFLKGTCADVRLYVRKWGVGWHVHKMVLVQAGKSEHSSTPAALTLRLLPLAIPGRLLGDELDAVAQGQGQGGGRGRLAW